MATVACCVGVKALLRTELLEDADLRCSVGSLSVPGDAIVEGNFNNEEDEATVNESGCSIPCEFPGGDGGTVMEIKV